MPSCRTDVKANISFYRFSSLVADGYEWGSQSSGITSYIEGDDSYLPPHPEELGHY